MRITENYKKGEIIEPDPTVVRILWRGMIEYQVLPHVKKAKKRQFKQHGQERFIP